MSAIAHVLVEQTTQQSNATVGSFASITGASITSSNFTAGKKYLIYATWQVNYTAGKCIFQFIHGSTAFGDSLQRTFEPIGGYDLSMGWFTVWTAVASEDITMQWNPVIAGTYLVDNISMFAMCLSDDVTESTDWFYAERAGTNDALSTTPTATNPTITFTPSGASDWLVLTYARETQGANGNIDTSVMDRTGEATSAVPTALVTRDSADALYRGILLGRVFSLTAVSNTFKEISSSSVASGDTRSDSKVFALNLNKFKNRNTLTYTAGPTNVTATATYGQVLQTASITPTVQSDVWIGAWHQFNRGTSTSRRLFFRLQLDNTDTPTGQTTALYDFSGGGNSPVFNSIPHQINTMASNVTAAAHTIDLDGYVDSTTGTPTVAQVSLWAITMELAAAGATNWGRLLGGETNRLVRPIT